MSDFIGAIRDFDFLNGEWRVANRRLKERLAGGSDWDEFLSTARLQTMLGGVANVDEFDCSARGFKGMTVRALDLEKKRWSIWWINSARGVLEPPVHGGFRDGKGLFYGDDVHDGRAVKVRFLWTADASHPRWEQAFSPDGGASWETNWIMEFSRR